MGGTLSDGEQQMPVIGRTLMTNPLLFLDEATKSLAPSIR
jgi:ABC-type branched-subunit amino acid transport system ATPase component